MKKTTLLILLTSSNLIFAELIREDYNPRPLVEGNTRVQELMEWNRDHPGEMPPLTDQEKYEIFTKRGMPIPGSGATIVNDIRGFNTNPSQLLMINKFNMDQKNIGYSEQSSDKAKKLLSMPETAEKEYNSRKSIAFNPYDTHLYESKNNLPMSYSYKSIPSDLATKIIGYAPESTFVNNGWTGAVEFFIPAFEGVCAYHEKNIEITKTAAFIPKEIATYKVNGKLTTISAVGNKESGFVYEVEWWDSKFKRNLECATEYYSESIKQDTIALAKQIDAA